MPVLGRRDLAASVLVAVLLATYLAFLATSNLLTPRGMTAITLVLTGATIILLADDEQPATLGWLTAALSVRIACAGSSLASDRRRRGGRRSRDQWPRVRVQRTCSRRWWRDSLRRGGTHRVPLARKGRNRS